MLVLKAAIGTKPSLLAWSLNGGFKQELTYERVLEVLKIRALASELRNAKTDSF
jgi:hypothetical protein